MIAELRSTRCIDAYAVAALRSRSGEIDAVFGTERDGNTRDRLRHEDRKGGAAVDCWNSKGRAGERIAHWADIIRIELNGRKGWGGREQTQGAADGWPSG